MVKKRTDTMEDYLKTVYKITSQKDRASTGEIADKLGVAPASVTEMVQRLASADPPLLVYRKHQGASLTPEGEQIALETLRHHRLLELFLHEILGYSWDQVHEEAEILEHVISEYFEERVAEVLGDPGQGIHGEPIPSRALEMSSHPEIYLHDLRPTQRGVIRSVRDDDPGFLRYLLKLRVTPGTKFQVREFSPYDHILYLIVEGQEEEIALGESATAQILVEIIEDAD
ncbi:MAG: metal-dependent transcriptional regulator [Anaerolineales bacterium]|nr:metal-dependent transcriptional regulator [Anaerolineales bacterium]